ncbi:sensor histidine kinase [Nocardioides sp. JQ2195]|uniref:sensor histidine kinase n=1 Tax=Nocardioides sp. JQ2195 TaxID=2592334 RepID=UPI00143EB421|nr:sensor histidine kinase [Nocardioides sp. JQ2195]QIX27812.1 sensor histidine kinase [Nocardioides sp. JQ2195]
MITLRAKPTRAPVTAGKSWRVTTAARVFVLALVFGLTLSSGTINSAGVILLALVLLASVCCVLEANPLTGPTPWTPLVEGVLTAALIGMTPGPIGALSIYLVIPPVVAGIRHGWVTTANTFLAEGFVMFGAGAAAEELGLVDAQMLSSAPWLLTGLGGGLLAAWQSRSVRNLASIQAPYEAAHHLVSQLHTLAQRLPVGLDSLTAARALNDATREGVSADRSAVIIRTAEDAFEPLIREGAISAVDERMASICFGTGRPLTGKGLLALPIRVGEHCFGVLLLGRATSWTKRQVQELQAVVDTQAVRLDTALLFDDVRSFATSEERNRLARDIHDGVAQEIASLGYMADEIADTSPDDATRKVANDLRAEITRVVSELRFSIFDLRHDLDEASSVSGALAEYVREVSHQSGMRVHLLFDERGPRLPQRVEQELLRIGQEAIGNARKHAHAINLWVTLTSDGKCVRLVIEDDGIGAATARPGHYGMHTMRERADRIGANFSVTSRADGGTVVTVQSRQSAGEITEGSNDGYKSPARR